jgi:hypothetical protein
MKAKSKLKTKKVSRGRSALYLQVPLNKLVEINEKITLQLRLSQTSELVKYVEQKCDFIIGYNNYANILINS